MKIRYPRTRLFLLCCGMLLFGASVHLEFPPFTILAGLYMLVGVAGDIDPLLDSNQEIKE